MTPALIIVSVLLVLLAAALWQRQVMLRREAFIRWFSLPHGLFEKLRKRHPQLTLKECQLVSHGLRQFFLAYLKSNRQFVSMPSQVADDLWHEFILYTRNYQAFCRKAFGRFLHHTPAVVLSSGVPMARTPPVHPHARGERLMTTRGISMLTGSSPRTWGTQDQSGRLRFA